jgi:hypothetical protein
MKATQEERVLSSCLKVSIGLNTQVKKIRDIEDDNEKLAAWRITLEAWSELRANWRLYLRIYRSN